MQKETYYKQLIYDLIKEQDLNDEVFKVGENYEKTHDLEPLSEIPDKISYEYYMKDKPLHNNERKLYKEVKRDKRLGLISQNWYNSLVSKEYGVLITKEPYEFNQVFMNAIDDLSKKYGLYHDKKVQERLKKPLLL